MKSWVFPVAAGLVAGVFGAALFGHFTIARPTQPPVAPPPTPRAAILPPGWDPGLTYRVTNLERRLDAVQPGPTPSPSDKLSPSQAGLSDREQERSDHYQKELASLEKSLSEHANEGVDIDWSRTESEQIQRDLRPDTLANSAQVKAVDCRSKTCTATLSFPTPADGLTLIQQNPDRLTVAGCNGFSAIPTPPSSDGPYDLTIVYTCR
jgi:hypothetical protein